MLVTEALQDMGAKNIKIELNEKTQIAQLSLAFVGKKEDIIKIITNEGYVVL